MPSTTYSKRHSTPATLMGYSDFRSAIRVLASIHDNIKGQSIPKEVMDFYKAMKNDDAFRPRMLRETVLGLEAALVDGVSGRQNLRAFALHRLVSAVSRLPITRLEHWLQADQRRLRRLPAASHTRLNQLRAGWLHEAAEMIDDTLEYADALVWEARAAAVANAKGLLVSR